MDALGLVGVVVVQEQLRLPDEEGPLRTILIAHAARRADHLLGRDAISPLGIDADEILSAPVTI
jgi:hypothetical protein